MAEPGSMPGFEVCGLPPCGAEITAVGPTDNEVVFVVHTKGEGFRYLDLKGKGEWTPAAAFSGPVAGEFGLYHASSGGDDEEPAATVSFVEVPRQSWACLRLPAARAMAAGAEAELVARTALPAEVVASCGAPGDAVAAVALANGTVRFLDLQSGKAAGKGAKLEAATGAARAEDSRLARLGPGRAVLVRGADFFVLQLDTEAQRTALQLKGSFRADVAPLPAEPLLGVASVEQERVLLCWGAGADGRMSFASATVSEEAPALCPLAPSEGAEGAKPAAWQCVGGYLAEWSRAPGGGALLGLRDARFGMALTSADAALPSKGALLSASSSAFSVLAGGSHATAVRWTLPPFGLHMVIGRGAAQRLRQEQQSPLAPLREACQGKRPLEDPELNDMFSAKRRATTDQALAEEVRNRRLPLTHDLVDLILRQKCWAAARALTSLPEAEEDLIVRLLAQRTELLARVVRRARNPHVLDVALRDHLPVSRMPEILELLLEWTEAHRDFTWDQLQEVAPGTPDLQDIVMFLSALADGCMPVLARLDADLLERVVNALAFCKAEALRTERIYALVRAASRIKGPLRPAGLPPLIEVDYVEF